MKKTLLATLVAFAMLFIATQSFAQFAYNFSKLNQTYTGLSAATSVTKGKLWNSDSLYTVPVGFNFKMAGTTTDKLYLQGAGFATPKRAAVQSGFIIYGTGLMDRGAQWMTSRSDIRYTTTGTSGSRVFKLEVYNAGFEDEYLNHGELKDSVSYQLWIFEGTNVVEFHYGPSMVSNFGEYFGPALTTGYMKNVDTAAGSFENLYLAKGSPSSPTLDSTASFSVMKGLSSVPPSGIVFRFTPKMNGPTSVEQVAPGSLAKVYPTQVKEILSIDHSSQQPLDFAILSMHGQTVAYGNAHKGRSTIDLSRVPAGTYIVRLTNAADQTYEAQKIIKL